VCRCACACVAGRRWSRRWLLNHTLVDRTSSS
jgi:hypothetical protein